MKRTAPLLALLLLVLGCATDDPYNEPRRGDGGPPQGGMRPQRAAMAGAGEIVPPVRWWHDPAVSTPLKLSGDQYQRLDAIDAKDGADIERLTQEAANAQRDFRVMLDADSPSASDIGGAGQRLRDARDRLLAQQVTLVAAERVVLTRDQWQTLQSQLRDERRAERGDRDGRRGGYPGGGMAGRGRGGRRPY